MNERKSRVQYLSPAGMVSNPAFSQVVVVEGNARTVYVGGQNGVDASGAVVGAGDLAAQTEQIFKNLEIALTAAGARLEHVVKWTIYVVQGHSFQAGFEVFQRVWGRRPNPPLVSLIYVAGLARPDVLVEMDAIAVVPAERD